MKKVLGKTVILTGAGISAESGIQTFRTSDGLWEDHRIEDVATPQGFYSNPTLVHNFYNARRQQLNDGDVQANPAHLALAKLEKALPHSVLLVTQNVDNLHEKAGSQNLVHMHGELNKARCDKTEKTYPWTEDMDIGTPCPCCHQKSNMRPDIVWFGEIPMQMDRVVAELEQCDLFLSIGTSGQVYPAAGFVALARDNGAHTVELNLDPTDIGAMFHESIHGKASDIVPAYVEQLLA